MRRIALLVITSLATLPAAAQILKCVDASGKIQYVDASKAAEMKCEPLRDETQTVRPQSGNVGSTTGRQPAPPGSDQPSPASLRQIKEAEARLAEARRKLAEQEAVRSGNEKNYARVQERLQPFQTQVEEAEKALEQARRNR